MAEIPFPTTVWMVLKPYKYWDFSYQPQLVSRIETPSTVSLRIQVCPIAKGLGPLHSYSKDGIGTQNILCWGGVWILRVESSIIYLEIMIRCHMYVYYIYIQIDTILCKSTNQVFSCFSFDTPNAPCLPCKKGARYLRKTSDPKCICLYMFTPYMTCIIHAWSDVGFNF